MRQRRIVRALAILLAGVVQCFTGCHRSDADGDIPRIAAGVAMRNVQFFSAALNREMPYRVFLPEQVPAEAKLPVVYLLHGGGGEYRDWSNYSDVSRYALRGMILVMPEGNASYYLNAAEKPGDTYEDYLVHDLIADVEARFPAKTGRANRAIAGVSMGGFGAVTMALRHPQMFIFAGGISTAIDVADRRFRLTRAGQWWGFREIFGPMGSASRTERNPLMLVKTADPRITPYLYLTAGVQEPLLEPNQRFANLLKQRGFSYEFHILPGGHDWKEWNAQVPGCFARMMEKLGVPAAK